MKYWTRGGNKMYEEKMEQQLHDYFQAEIISIEPTLDWWDRTIYNVTGQKKASRRYGFLPRTRLAWVFLPLLLLLLVGGTVYAASPQMREIFLKYAGHIEKAGLVQQMDMSQTVNGVTVRLERVYADNNEVLLGYTVSGPTGKYLTHGEKLVTIDGQILSSGGGRGFVRNSTGELGNWAPSESVAMISSFDASGISGSPEKLNLKLTVPVLDWTKPGIDAPVLGVFTFDFSVPVHPGKTIAVNQTVEAAGIPITLRKVEISPYETKAFFQPLPQDIQDNGAILSQITLKMQSGKSIENSSGGKQGELLVSYFMGDLTGQHGEWTVTINELVSPGFDITHAIEVPGVPGAYYCTDCPPSPRVSGPWVFHFKVP
jgi:hypothetical protein